MVFANTKLQKIHSYIPAKIMLEFSLQIKYFDIKWEPPIKADLEIKDTTNY